MGYPGTPRNHPLILIGISHGNNSSIDLGVPMGSLYLWKLTFGPASSNQIDR